LTVEQVAEFKEVFMLFDKDEDGVITFPEVIMVMKSLGQRPSDEELLEMVQKSLRIKCMTPLNSTSICK